MITGFKGLHRLDNTVFDRMSEIVRNYRNNKIPPDIAREVAHDFMKILKDCIPEDDIVVLNPKLFSSAHLLLAKTEIFKRKSFPFFCHGIIDHCNMVVAHGYILNEHIKSILLNWFKYPFSRKGKIREYLDKLIEIVENANDMLWSPGTFEEIKYALRQNIEVFIVSENALHKLSKVEIRRIKKYVIPFDKHNLYLYNKIWQPIVDSVYRILTFVTNKCSIID